MNVEVDESRCVAAGNCAAFAPAVFDQRDDDGTVILLDPAPPESEYERVREAHPRCPAAAIVLHENPSDRGK
ncbi:ferredoxin [Streptomyces sp. NPDC059850]|uniref:ferredoxin n=1 Tax=Streptomyces sp. NPDC059850 TaxID=3346970 RepID=UPI0036599BAE